MEKEPTRPTKATADEPETCPTCGAPIQHVRFGKGLIALCPKDGPVGSRPDPDRVQ